MTQSQLHATITPDKASCMEDFVYLKEKQIHSCPICSKELMYDGLKSLETLTEHVSDPNGEPVPKFCFKCGYKYCIANYLDFGWSSDGALYALGKFYNADQIKFKDDIHSSIGSFCRGFDEKQAWEKSRTFNIRIGRVEHYDFLHLELQLYPNNPLHWSVVIWWKGCWIMSIPGTVIWKIKRYIRKGDTP